jgi:hypothetical protein
VEAAAAAAGSKQLSIDRRDPIRPYRPVVFLIGGFTVFYLLDFAGVFFAMGMYVFWVPVSGSGGEKGAPCGHCSFPLSLSLQPKTPSHQSYAVSVEV